VLLLTVATQDAPVLKYLLMQKLILVLGIVVGLAAAAVGMQSGSALVVVAWLGRACAGRPAAP
jgi:hypothetical protein